MVRVLGYLVVASAAVIVALIVGATEAQRSREIAVLKEALGARRGFLLRAHGVEFGALGLMAGALGAALGGACAAPRHELVPDSLERCCTPASHSLW